MKNLVFLVVFSKFVQSNPQVDTFVSALETKHDAQRLKSLDWMIGTWRGEFNGKTSWPTIPTLTYGEELIITLAPKAIDGPQLLNWTARSWSHSTKDHLHDECGYLGVDAYGDAVLMTSGNNGFNKYETGTIRENYMMLKLQDIGRVSFTRDLPVKDLRREFRILSDNSLEQVLSMRTETHPYGEGTIREHARIRYKK